jgi:hypothetical protein
MVNKHDLYAMAGMTNVNMYTQKYSPHSFPAEPHAQFLFLFLSYTIFYTMKGTVVILFFTLLSSLYLEALHQGEVAKTDRRANVPRRALRTDHEKVVSVVASQSEVFRET